MRVKAPGIAAYAAMLLWLLVTAMTPMRADAAEIVARRVGDILPEIAAALSSQGAAAASIVLLDPEAAFFDVEGAAPVLNVASYDFGTGRFTVNLAADGQTLAINGAATPQASARPAPARQTASPVLVKRGASVAMIYESAGLKVTHMGVAMQSGAEGAFIDVKNLKSERVIKAEIVGGGAVAVLSPKNTLALVRTETKR